MIGIIASSRVRSRMIWCNNLACCSFYEVSNYAGLPRPMLVISGMPTSLLQIDRSEQAKSRKKFLKNVRSRTDLKGSAAIANWCTNLLCKYSRADIKALKIAAFSMTCCLSFKALFSYEPWTSSSSPKNTQAFDIFLRRPCQLCRPCLIYRQV